MKSLVLAVTASQPTDVMKESLYTWLEMADDDDYKGILNAIYNIGPEEIKILDAITTKIQREYQLNFSFGDVTCPHCKNITRNMDVTMDELVFQTYQRLISTEVDLKNIQGL